MTDSQRPRPAISPLVLIIRDGWGENPNPSHDAFNAVKIAAARGLTPTALMLDAQWPRTLIATSGEDVGLPPGTMGNSEVGHQNIGAGRIVPQESLVMTKACETGLDRIEAVKGAVDAARSGGGRIHIMGICSDAGVHGLLEHLYAMMRACKKLGAADLFLHMFTDGRDTGPFTGIDFIERVEAACKDIGTGSIATVVGRYYAMDRDHRWERVKAAYDCLTGRGMWTTGEGPTASSAALAIQRYYDAPSGETLRGDEFVTPTAIGDSPADIRAGRIRAGDSVIFFNYRGDRPRELSAAFVFPDEQWAAVKPSPDSGLRGFDRGPKLALHYVTMTDYWDALRPFVHVAFPKPPRMRQIGGEFFSSRGLRQFRCAETEKYPHVTFFFNDYRDEPFPGESRVNPQSPRVATYDQKPEMAAHEVAAATLARLAADDCEDFLVVNFANGDMVGHTGNLEATISACAAVDECVGRIIQATLARGGALIVTADHGNAEQMFDPATNAPHTAHTTYTVPLYVVGDSLRGRTLRAGGRLADILPTAIHIMGLTQPQEMTGRSLLA